MNELTITEPDDWHLHVRDGAALNTVVPHSAQQFSRAIIMPNLVPPVTTTAQAEAYRTRIIAAVPADCHFDPLMTLYLTDRTTSDEIRRGKHSSIIHACKLYPAGATTNSASGVTDIRGLSSVLETLQRESVPLLIHGEVTDPEIDIFDREAVFIDRILLPLVLAFPELRIVLEHITTEEAVAFIQATPNPVAATVTAHHLLLNRNAIFEGGLQPHRYCLPVLKRDRHRRALLEAATSGNPKFFLGTDSAPHPRQSKESDCGCAGCYTAAQAMALYASAFEQVDRLDRLEGFASFFGADFYGLARNKTTITLRREPDRVADYYPYADTELKPLYSGRTLPWRLAESAEATR